MRRAALLLLTLVTLAGCGATSNQEAAAGELAVERAAMHPGTIDLFVHNGTARRTTLAQVAIDSGFVGFSGPATAVAAGGDAVLTVPYPWVRGEGYTVKVITGDGATLDYRIDPQ